MLILWLNDIFLLLLYIFHEYYFRGVAPSGLSSRLVYAVQGFTPLPGGCRPFRTGESHIRRYHTINSIELTYHNSKFKIHDS